MIQDGGIFIKLEKKNPSPLSRYIFTILLGNYSIQHVAA